jgi:ribosomal protein L37AE/L43A
MDCPNCITKPQMVEVKVNLWVCPVCDLVVQKRESKAP